MNQLYPLSRYRELHSGDLVVLTKNISNNSVTYSPMTRGRIVEANNCVEARIWIRENMKTVQSVHLNSEYSKKNGRFEGLVLNISGDSFAINFNYRDHSEIIISEEKALKLPLFEIIEEKRKPSGWISNGVQGYEYLLCQVIDYMEDTFADWVKKNTVTVPITDEEKENGDYPSDWDTRFEGKSESEFIAMQDKLDLEFAKITGFYHHFLGGTIED